MNAIRNAMLSLSCDLRVSKYSVGYFEPKLHILKTGANTAKFAISCLQVCQLMVRKSYANVN